LPPGFKSINANTRQQYRTASKAVSDVKRLRDPPIAEFFGAQNDNVVIT
jgi:hypothetical protein